MLDREKVVKGLEYCSTHDCSILCPYWFGCDTHSLAKEALALLKEQEERIKKFELERSWDENPDTMGKW